MSEQKVTRKQVFKASKEYVEAIENLPPIYSSSSSIDWFHLKHQPS